MDLVAISIVEHLTHDIGTVESRIRDDAYCRCSLSGDPQFDRHATDIRDLDDLGSVDEFAFGHTCADAEQKHERLSRLRCNIGRERPIELSTVDRRFDFDTVEPSGSFDVPEASGVGVSDREIGERGIGQVVERDLREPR